MNHLAHAIITLGAWLQGGNQPATHPQPPKKQSSRFEDRFEQAIELTEFIQTTDPKLARELRRR